MRIEPQVDQAVAVMVVDDAGCGHRHAFVEIERAVHIQRLRRLTDKLQMQDHMFQIRLPTELGYAKAIPFVSPRWS